MGVQITLSNVDFGDSAFTCFDAQLSGGGVNVVKWNPNQGNFDYLEEPAKRIKSLPIVFVKKGERVIFRGLTGKDKDGNECTLRIDGCAYSSKENPSHETCIRSISDSTTTYFTLNSELKNEFGWINDIGDYWFVFCFGSNQTIDASKQVYCKDFSISIMVL